MEINMYYIEKDGKIIIYDTDRQRLANTQSFMPKYADCEILETDRPIENNEFADTEDFILKKELENRQKYDALTLTPSDVERALYKAKGMDFDDLKQLISQQLPDVDMKALNIEFRAKDFYRGATINTVRLFDVIGALLGYTEDDMDYLFNHKQLPEKSKPISD